MHLIALERLRWEGEKSWVILGYRRIERVLEPDSLSRLDLVN